MKVFHLLDEEKLDPSKYPVKNTFMLDVHANFLKILGLYPIGFGITSSLVGQIYAIILFGSFAVILVWTCFQVLMNGLEVLPDFQQILNFIWITVLIIFVVILLINGITKVRSWQNLKESVSNFDAHFSKNKDTVVGRKWNILKFLFARFCLLFLIAWDCLFWYWRSNAESSLDVVLYWPAQFGVIYQTLVSLFIREICVLLKSRYDFSKQYVKIILNIRLHNEISKKQFINPESRK